jgi:O-antigen/teichoic acid export membrane protein
MRSALSGSNQSGVSTTKISGQSGLKNFIYVTGANILSLLAGVLTGLIAPKLLGVEEFAYWQIFLLYVNYVGLLHFGFNDGVYLRYGHYDYHELPKERFRSYFTFLFLFQGAIAAVLTLIIFAFSKDTVRAWIFLYVFINMVLINLTTYFAFINQITKRFSVYARLLTASKLIYIVAIAGIFFVRERFHMQFIIIHTGVNALTLAAYVYQSRDLVWGPREPMRSCWKDLIQNISVGFFVMIGNFMGLAIIGLDKLFVERFFTLQDFAMYSFAAAMISVVYLLLNAVSTAVYPYLARIKDESVLKVLYERAGRVIFLFSGLALAGYFVFSLIVEWFLPQYVEALPVALILFATTYLKAKISIIGANYYKALQLQRQYTLNNILALTAGAVTSIIAVVLYPENAAIAAASVVAFYLWYFYTESFFKKRLGVKVFKETIANTVLTAVFLVIGLAIRQWYIGIIAYLFFLLLMYFLLYFNDLRNMVKNGTAYFMEA